MISRQSGEVFKKDEKKYFTKLGTNLDKSMNNRTAISFHTTI